MNEPLSPRLLHIDLRKSVLVLDHSKTYVPELIAKLQSEPGKLLKTRWSSLASDYETIALYSYALGSPLSEVRQSFRNCVIAYAKVVENREGESGFSAYDLRYQSDFPPGHSDSIAEFKPLYDEKSKDYSLTNSRNQYLAVCEALIAGEDALADQLARSIWDPSNASYIGPRSFCTPNDQCLAYALREFFKGNTVDAQFELNKFRRTKVSAVANDEAAMIQSLLDNNADHFKDGLASLLARHGREAVSKKNSSNPEFFICVPGLGLCKIAILRQMLTREELPQKNVFLPIELLG